MIIDFPLATTSVDGKLAATDKVKLDTLGTASSKNTGTSSGNVPVLDGSGKLDSSVLPAIALTEYKGTVASQAAMVLLTAEPGDWVIRSDINGGTVYVLSAAPAATAGNWKPIAAFTGFVDANIATGAAIDAAKIANGLVSNTEFQFLDGVTSAIQTQITTNATTAASAVTTHAALTIAHGATGAVVGTTNAQTLTNKTLSASTITGATPVLSGTTVTFNSGANLAFATGSTALVNSGVTVTMNGTFTRMGFTNGTTAANGIVWGTDTNLYRSAADTLTTDDSLVVAGAAGISLPSTAGFGSGLLLGGDTRVYRDGTNILRLTASDAVYLNNYVQVRGATSTLLVAPPGTSTAGGTYTLSVGSGNTTTGYACTQVGYQNASQTSLYSTQAGRYNSQSGYSNAQVGDTNTQTSSHSTQSGYQNIQDGFKQAQSGMQNTQSGFWGQQSGYQNQQNDITANTQSGTYNVQNGNASLQAGSRNTQAGYYAAQFGNSNTQGGNYGFQAGFNLDDNNFPHCYMFGNTVSAGFGSVMYVWTDNGMILQPLSSLPLVSESGQIHFNDTLGLVYYLNGNFYQVTATIIP